MDALKFLKEQKRMCKKVNDCSKCPAYIGKCDCYIMFLADTEDEMYTNDFFKKAIEIVEEWSDSNPIYTNGDMIKTTYEPYIVSENTEDNFIIFDRSWWDSEYVGDKEN